nr:hypothetical protein [Nocardioides alcanivorans]
MARPVGRGALISLGFQDPDRAREDFARLGDEVGTALQPVLRETPDPDLALRSFVDLLDVVADAPALLDRLAEHCDTARRLFQVLGGSRALGEHLHRHPEQWHELDDDALGVTRPPAYFLRECLMRAVGADPGADEPASTLPDHEALDALRVEYRRLLMRLAARDLAHGAELSDIAAEISDLAAGTLDAALAVARTRVGRVPRPPASRSSRWASAAAMN